MLHMFSLIVFDIFSLWYFTVLLVNCSFQALNLSATENISSQNSGFGASTSQSKIMAFFWGLDLTEQSSTIKNKPKVPQMTFSFMLEYLLQIHLKESLIILKKSRLDLMVFCLYYLQKPPKVTRVRVTSQTAVYHLTAMCHTLTTMKIVHYRVTVNILAEWKRHSTK